MMYWNDSLLRAPFFGSILISMMAAWMGTLLYLQRRTLVGELVSHASYPGIVLAILLSSGLAPDWAVVLGGIATSWFVLRALRAMERRKTSTDAALTFLLASSFGIGILAVSYLQGTLPRATLLLQSFLYGQAATLTDSAVRTYALLAGCIALCWFAVFPLLRTHLFDRTFAQSVGVPVQRIDRLILLLTLCTIALGIRSVGVILMTGLLIAPPVAARAWTNRLGTLLLLAGGIGALSGLVGLVLSVEGALAWKAHMGLARFTLPTGPVIVLVGSACALVSLLIAPKRGWIARWFRSRAFRHKVQEEHLLKALWKRDPIAPTRAYQRLVRQGWIAPDGKLTEDGERRAASIIRLHRLWEVYLTELGVDPHQVHGSAEEMEHVLTREMEERLTRLLANPKADPHDQPIPERGAKR